MEKVFFAFVVVAVAVVVAAAAVVVLTAFKTVKIFPPKRLS